MEASYSVTVRIESAKDGLAFQVTNGNVEQAIDVLSRAINWLKIKEENKTENK